MSVVDPEAQSRSHVLKGIADSRSTWPVPARYGLAAALIAAALLAQLLWLSPVDGALACLSYCPVILVVALLAGFGPALFAAACAVAAVALSPAGAVFSATAPARAELALGLFLLTASGIAALAGRWQATRQRSEDRARALDSAALQLEQVIRQHARAEARLRESEERFRLAASSDGITLYEQDSALRYTWLYPQHPEHEPALGRTDAELAPGAEGERLMQLKRMVMEREVAQRTEVRVQLGSATRYYDTFITPRRDPTGRVVGVAGTALDVTERRQREQSRQLLAAIVESSEDAIIALDLSASITSWNQGAARLFGYEPHETIGRPVTLLIPPERYHEEPQILERIRRGERIEHYETRRRRKDGTELEISLSVSPLRDEHGEIVGASKIARDVTARNRADRDRRFLAALNERIAGREQPDDIAQTAARLVGQHLGVRQCCFAEWTEREGAVVVSHRWGLPVPPGTVTVPELWAAVPPEWRRRFARGWNVADLARAAAESRLAEMCTAAGLRSLAAAGLQRKSSRLVALFAGTPEPRAWRDDEIRLLKTVVERVWPLVERARSEAALRASEQQLRLITDHAPVSLAQLDRERRLKFVNQTYARRLGRDAADLIGRPLIEVIGATTYARIQPQLDGALAGRHMEFETEIVLPVGGVRWVHAVYTPETDATGTVVGVIALITDITARKEAEREVALARDHALAASRAKDDFLAALSHELRTPLNPVLLIASEAAENLALPAEIRRDFATIRKNVELEARLIDDLLDVTRITHGKLPLDLRPVNGEAILQDALSVIRPDAEQKRITIATEFAALRTTVRADAVRLQQVFWNVLKNAVKFTPAGGRITLATLNPDGVEHFQVVVRDNGIGMTSAEIGRVFDAFSQGDHAAGISSHRFGGLGLGLTISRLLVEQHQGSIRAESEGPGQGATFVIELPVTAQLPLRASSTMPVDGVQPRRIETRVTRRRGRVLLVEDHAPTRDALASLLRRRSYEVLTAGSLAEARAHLAEGGVGLLVSDIGLPDGDGCDLMSELRGRQELRGIALTGYGMDADIARSTRAGFFAHLTKPIRVQALDAVLTAIDSAPADLVHPAG